MNTLNPAIVAAYDEFLYLRDLLLHNPVSELLIALYFVASFFVALMLLFYWAGCVLLLFQCSGEELSDPELESLRLDRGLFSSLFHLLLPSATLLH